MRKPEKRKISAGTVAVLLLTLVILGGTVFVWLRLSSGKTVDLSSLKPEVEDLQVKAGNMNEIPESSRAVTSTPVVVATQTPEPYGPEDTEQEPEVRSFTLTAAGTVSLAGEVRKNSYSSDAKQYDYYDTMALLKKELDSDLNIVFTENLYSGEEKSTDLTAPEAAASMLKAAGFNAAACGYSKAFDKGETGIASTRKVLEENGIRPIGIYENDGAEHIPVFSENGIMTALLQYTDTIPAATRKSMTKNGLGGTVPAADTEAIAADIARARDMGCDAVLVFRNWGKTGRGPDKNMKKLVQAIADAGADLIIGSGNRIVSGAEMLTAAETGRQVLCVWSLGTTLSGDRNNVKRIAGMLLQATVTVTDGQTEIRDVRYIPLYTWKYRQDSRYYYRCLAADREAPDGMDSEQKKMMKKAADAVHDAMKDTPAEERSLE